MADPEAIAKVCCVLDYRCGLRSAQTARMPATQLPVAYLL